MDIDEGIHGTQVDLYGLVYTNFVWHPKEQFFNQIDK